jgi:hypothetical protein
MGLRGLGEWVLSRLRPDQKTRKAEAAQNHLLFCRRHTQTTADYF